MLQQLLNDHQLYHSDLQMDSFITMRSGGTTYGMYKQALRELFKRYRGLKEQYPARELLLLDIEELETTQSKREKIELAKKRMALDDMNRGIRDTEREFNHFYAQAKALKDIIGELTPEKRNKLDMEMWIFKAKENAAFDYITRGSLSKGTVELVQYMPTDIRIQIFKEITERDTAKNRAKILDWFEQVEYKLPEFKVIECKDVRLLIEGERNVKAV